MAWKVPWFNDRRGFAPPQYRSAKAAQVQSYMQATERYGTKRKKTFTMKPRKHKGG
jgi:hypothetical protein